MSAKKKNSTYDAFNNAMKAFEKRRGIKPKSWRNGARMDFARRNAEIIETEPDAYAIGRGEV